MKTILNQVSWHIADIDRKVTDPCVMPSTSLPLPPPVVRALCVREGSWAEARMSFTYQNAFY